MSFLIVVWFPLTLYTLPVHVGVVSIGAGYSVSDTGWPQAKWLQGFVRVDNGWHRIGLIVACVATVRALCCFMCC